MSIRVMNRVWEHAPYKGGALLVLLALADFADDRGICWPDMEALSDKARLSERETSTIIQKLEKDEAIAYQRGGGRGKRSGYAVLVGLTDSDKERVKEFHRNYFREKNTVKSGAQKGEVYRRERVKFGVVESEGLGQQEAPNPTPNRQGTVKEPPPPAKKAQETGHERQVAAAAERVKQHVIEATGEPCSMQMARAIGQHVASGKTDIATVIATFDNMRKSKSLGIGGILTNLVDSPPPPGKPYGGKPAKSTALSDIYPSPPPAEPERFLSRAELKALEAKQRELHRG